MATTAGFKKDDHVIVTVRGTDHRIWEFPGVVTGESLTGYILVDVGQGMTMHVTSAELRFQELVA